MDISKKYEGDILNTRLHICTVADINEQIAKPNVHLLLTEQVIAKGLSFAKTETIRLLETADDKLLDGEQLVETENGEKVTTYNAVKTDKYFSLQGLDDTAEVVVKFVKDKATAKFKPFVYPINGWYGEFLKAFETFVYKDKAEVLEGFKKDLCTRINISVFKKGAANFEVAKSAKELLHR